MSKKDEYISVAEFAELAGVSVQAVYKRLNQDLNQYSTRFKGKIRLNIRALELFDSTEFKPEFKPNFKLFKPVENENSDEFQGEIIEILRRTIDNLENQLSVKDKQIDQSQKTIDGLQKALDQSQQLQALEQTKSIKKSNEEENGVKGLDSYKKDISGRPAFPKDIWNYIDEQCETHYQNGEEKGKNEIIKQTLDIIRLLTLCLDEGSFFVKKSMDKNEIDVKLTRTIPDSEVAEPLINLIKEAIRTGWNMKPKTFFRNEKL